MDGGVGGGFTYYTHHCILTGSSFGTKLWYSAPDPATNS